MLPDMRITTKNGDRRKSTLDADALLTEAWRKATKADRRAEIVKTADSSQIAFNAWRAFNRLAKTLS
jgi:hypothetical protein